MNTTTPTPYAYPPPLALRTSPDTTFALHGKYPPAAHVLPIPPALMSGAFPLLGEDEWRDRIDRIWVCLSRWAWSLPQRIVLVLFGVLTLIVPMVTSILVNRLTFGDEGPLPDNPTQDEVQQRFDQLRRAHFVSLGIVAASYAGMWLPYVAFKLVARKRINTLLQSFSEQDAKKGDMSALRWSLMRTSTLARSATIMLVIPPAYLSAHQPSHFAPNAYLPPYLQKDPDPSPAYGTMPAATIPIQPAPQPHGGAQADQHV